MKQTRGTAGKAQALQAPPTSAWPTTIWPSVEYPGGLSVEGPGQHKPPYLLTACEWLVGGGGQPRGHLGELRTRALPCWPEATQ